MIDRVNGRVAVLLSAGVVLLVLLIGWFVFVAPQRSKAANLDSQIGSTNDQIASTQTYLRSGVNRRSKLELRHLEKVFPGDVHMSQIIRQLVAAAATAKVALNAISPGALVPSAGGQAVPITLTVQGHYFGIRTFLHLLRMRATANGKTVKGTGRLYSIDGMQFSGGSGNVVSASLSIDAYTSLAPPVAPPTPTTTTDTTTGP
jgi:hypothetical protein